MKMILTIILLIIRKMFSIFRKKQKDESHYNKAKTVTSVKQIEQKKYNHGAGFAEYRPNSSRTFNPINNRKATRGRNFKFHFWGKNGETVKIFATKNEVAQKSNTTQKIFRFGDGQVSANKRDVAINNGLSPFVFNQPDGDVEIFALNTGNAIRKLNNHESVPTLVI